MHQNQSISDIMTKNVITVKVDEKFSKVRKIMKEEKIRHVPVVDDNKLVGIISQKDVLRNCLSNQLNYTENQEDEYLDANIQIADIMAKNVVTLKTNDSIKDVVKIITTKTFHSIPIVNEDNEVAGTISINEVLLYLKNNVKHGLNVRKIMTEDVVTATTVDKFSKINQQMEDNSINHIPIVEGRKIVGIISRIDLLKASFNESDKSSNEYLDHNVKISSIMTKDVITLKDYDVVDHAIEIFIEHQFNCLPIINKDQDLVGIVSTKDMSTALLSLY